MPPFFATFTDTGNGIAEEMNAGPALHDLGWICHCEAAELPLLRKSSTHPKWM